MILPKLMGAAIDLCLGMMGMGLFASYEHELSGLQHLMTYDTRRQRIKVTASAGSEGLTENARLKATLCPSLWVSHRTPSHSIRMPNCGLVLPSSAVARVLRMPFFVCLCLCLCLRSALWTHAY